MSATDARYTARVLAPATKAISDGTGAQVPVRVYEPGAGDGRQYPQVPPGMGLVWVHGGGFVKGDLDMPEAHKTAESFAACNATVVSVDYRLCQGGTTWPAPSDDVLTAWQWSLDHAAELGIDPRKLILGGASAGGNLVSGAVLRLLAASSNKLPSGVFLAYPTLHAVQAPTPESLQRLVARLPDPTRFSAPNLLTMYENYLGGPVAGAPAAAIPGTADLGQLGGFPPTIMINGEADELRVSGEAFAASLQQAGTSVETVTEPGTAHGHLNRPHEDAAARTVHRVVDWANRNLST
ncbi:alpha/beta hydrolase [Arthrobacter sp. NPDC057388]|uniref:alpha/beta hydrolase n=1 Tax=Arthrobacter sp. NPDC057388 TaxID=3346116 RepID=UPI0036302A63